MANKKKEENKDKTESTEKETIKVNTDKIKKEVLDYVNNNLKLELNTHIDQTIKNEFLEVLEKQHRKEIKAKNKKILVKNILILLLLVCIGILCYVFYTNGYFKKYMEEYINDNNKTVEKKDVTVTDTEPTLDELKAKYSSLLDNYVLFETSNYNEDFYNKKLTEQIKLYYVFNNLDFDKLEKEDDYYLIDEDIIKDKYNELFKDGYKANSFNYNNHNIKYFSKLKSFATDTIFEKDNSNIVREIIEITEDKNIVTITTIEGLVQDGVLYNPKTREVIDEEYTGNLLDYQDSLEKVTYAFDEEKLIEIR